MADDAVRHPAPGGPARDPSAPERVRGTPEGDRARRGPRRRHAAVDRPRGVHRGAAVRAVRPVQRHHRPPRRPRRARGTCRGPRRGW